MLFVFDIYRVFMEYFQISYYFFVKYMLFDNCFVLLVIQTFSCKIFILGSMKFIALDFVAIMQFKETVY